MRYLLLFILLVTACGSPDASAANVAPAEPLEPIRISMSMYVLDDIDGGESSALSSQRQVAEIEEVATRMNAIWDQAAIELVIDTVTRIDVPAAVLTDLAAGDTFSFLEAAASGAFAVPNPATINGFYVRQIGTANGLAPLRSRVFFVADEPTVHDERVSSHELGHILGLHHDLANAGRLMFSGTNGTELTTEQVNAARYTATGILDGVR